jgi:hypothetical protein
VLIQQMNSLTGPINVTGGRLTLENVNFGRDCRPHLSVGPKCEAVRVLANLSAAGDFRIDNEAGDRLYARGNSAPFPPTGTHFTLKTGWEAGEPSGEPNVVAVGGGSTGVNNGQCAAVDSADAHSGKRMLRLAGAIDTPKYAFAYYKILDGPVDVASDSTITYWLRPVNENGCHCGIDVLFTDGSILRDLDGHDTAGVPVHPETARGVVGQWTKIEVPLGQFVGKTIATVMFAYDQRDAAAGGFEAWMDDLAIDSPGSVGPWQITITPPGGTCAVGTAIRLRQPQGAKMHYTLDGISPSAKSPVYTKGIVLGKPGLWELRCAVELPDGSVTSRAFSALYQVTAE